MKRILFIIVSALLVLTVSLAASADWFKTGDINGDGEIKANDARAILRYCAELDDGTYLKLGYADVTNDGLIRANDARTVLRVAADVDEFAAADNDITLTEQKAADASRVKGCDFSGDEPAEDEISCHINAYAVQSSASDPREESICASVTFFDQSINSDVVMPCTVTMEIFGSDGEKVYTTGQAFGEYSRCEAERRHDGELRNITSNGWVKHLGEDGGLVSATLYYNIDRDLIPGREQNYKLVVTVLNGSYFRCSATFDDISFFCDECSWGLTAEEEGFCGNRGFRIWECSVCGNIKTEFTDAPGKHELELEEKYPATCIIDGWEKYFCRICGESVYDFTEAPGCHDYGDGGICERCGWHYIPATADEKDLIRDVSPELHAFAFRGSAEGEIDNSMLCFLMTFREPDDSVADEDAEYYGIPCGLILDVRDFDGETVYMDNRVILADDYTPALNGNPEYIFELPADEMMNYDVYYTVYYENGSFDSDCIPVPPACTLHEFVSVEKVAPTCTMEGYTDYVCEKCGELYREFTDPTGHDYDENGLCANCGLYFIPMTDEERAMMEEKELYYSFNAYTEPFEGFTGDRPTIRAEVMFSEITDEDDPSSAEYISVPFGMKTVIEDKDGNVVYTWHQVVSPEDFFTTYEGYPIYWQRTYVSEDAAFDRSSYFLVTTTIYSGDKYYAVEKKVVTFFDDEIE